MEQSITEQIESGIQTAFINKNISSNTMYRPQLIFNNHKEGRKVLSSIKSELMQCDEFFISVAFITMSGLTTMLQNLKDLEKRNIKGKILTTDYLTFTDPKALEKLMELSNIEVKMYKSGSEGFHTKGYIFKKHEIYKIIVGSANMTGSALTTNKEWNTKVISTSQGEYTADIIEEFNNLWNSEHSYKVDKILNEYKENYLKNKEKMKLSNRKDEDDLSSGISNLKPNIMQRQFITNLLKLVDEGEDKALLISATGTGKTYAAAFALKELNPKRVLFLVHREQIAKQAIRSFKKVFGSKISFGLLSGNAKERNADYVFAMMNTMCKDNILHSFKSDEFDVIVVDEVHRIGSNSYQKIMQYYKPKLCLGMTASPDRSDGFDVYEFFDHNIVYEIRLQQAMEEDLLCPFHYFGISDLEIIGSDKLKEDEFKQFSALTSDERVKHVLDKAKYYGYSGDRVKGLVFCSRKTEAIELSRKFNEVGFKTIALSSDENQQVREQAIERLSSNSVENQLDYIFTVDIFNEGVDIPDINQVIMLRPTQSPIVFIQQLGRGLRKADEKEYVVILDFIGNYTNNFMIPIALSGDRSYNKDNIRRYIMEGERVIPGASTIQFDKISKKKIFDSIDQSNFNNITLIKENYFNLKRKLGRIPSLKDFDDYGEMDVLRIFDNKSIGSYYKFLVKYEKDYKLRLSDKEEKTIEFISRKLASGKRVHELILLKQLISLPTNVIHKFIETMKDEYEISISQNTIDNVVNVLINEFPTGTGKETYQDCVFLESNGNGEYTTSILFKSLLQNTTFKKILNELIDFGIHRYNLQYSNKDRHLNLSLYQKYTYEDVCRLLDWENNGNPQNIGGYQYDPKTKTFPVFINYEKEDHISDTTKYEDRFLSPKQLIALSKAGRRITSNDIQNFIHAKERGIEVMLFVRKNKNDSGSKEFYYLGGISASGNVEEVVMGNTNKRAVEIEWNLDVPVREDIYDYITNG